MRPRLFTFERAWTDAIWDAIFPAPPAHGDDRPHLVHGIAQLAPGRYLDDALQVIPFEQALGLRLTLWVIAFAPLFVLKRFATMGGLGFDDRVRVMDTLIASESYLVRQMATGFKAVATLLYARSREIRTQMQTPLRAEQSERLIAIRTSQTRVKKSPTTAPRSASHDHAAE
ncbi:MAG: hypothetical protein JST00_08620 [Deltaproteobacteria bacterium]|nr:hypothetical protein [Deltaproteobacteria bacterium]